ncbi:hypothetical protein ITJ86_03840 [Winogradskyella sp. F6397]|uniref:Polysaccharide chain length determinant N-terminal domain-containing protein n=1 Tax=Winogradskyella marina TaxID=2785530 RepID=A0ABS0EFI4_9FLAO|nr:hypothetical protein [Winogradskyella marina]MBF8149013.1 hypothetical protein [Winogradskyella marina]
MSEKLPQQPQNEEVDLGQLFNAIGRLFEKLFAFIGSIFKGIFSAIIYTIKPLIDYFKIVVGVVIIAIVLGVIFEKSKEPLYLSSMVVETHFDSKYQLVRDIDYFNALAKSNSGSELSKIFEIDESFASKLKGFELEPGPVTQNDLFVEYDEYLKSIDTSLVEQLTYESYVNNRDVLSGSIYTITAYAYEQDIFHKLNEGFRKTFENEFSKHQKQIRDSLVAIERLTLTTELSRLDSIQNTYLEVLKNESKNRDISFGLTAGIPLQEEKSITKEYDLFLKEQEIRRSLNNINKSTAEKDTYFDIVSNFDRLGSKDKGVTQRYFILFPVIAIILILVFFLAVKAFKFIKEYE